MVWGGGMFWVYYLLPKGLSIGCTVPYRFTCGSLQRCATKRYTKSYDVFSLIAERIENACEREVGRLSDLPPVQAKGR